MKNKLAYFYGFLHAFFGFSVSVSDLPNWFNQEMRKSFLDGYFKN